MTALFLIFIVNAFTIITSKNIASIVSDLELIHVQVLFRHGDRAPLKIYPNDPYSAINWPNGLEQLTQQGEEQAFTLGRFLRNRYLNFLPPFYFSDDVFINSSESTRCVQSARCVLSGLYASETTKENWQFCSNFTEIPINTKPPQNDSTFRTYRHCPKYVFLQQESNSNEGKSIENEYQTFFDYLTNNTGEIVTMHNIDLVYDTLFCEKAHNFSLPNWVTDNVYNKLQYLNNLRWHLATYTSELKLLLAGTLPYTILTKLNEAKERNIPKTTGKIFNLYSGHDTNIMGLLASMRLFDEPSQWLQPQYSSAIIIELHKSNAENKHNQESEKSFIVKIWYKNQTMSNDLIHVIPPACGQMDCSLRDFIKIYQSENIIFPNQYKTKCATIN